MFTKHDGAGNAGLEFKAVKFVATNLDAKTGRFSGYASTFGNEDLGGDVVEKGAFAKSLAGQTVTAVKMLYEHDPLQPIGYWNALAEDGKGLMADGQLLIEDVAKAREVHALMKHGVLDGLSIGYHVLQADHDRKRGVRVLQEIDLKEISAVLFPMNPNAVIAAVKSSIDGSLLDIREFERWLQRDAGLTRSKSLEVVTRLKSLLPSLRDSAGEVAKSTPPNAVDQLALLAATVSAFTETIRQETSNHG